MSFQAYLDNIQAKTGKSPTISGPMPPRRAHTEGGALKPSVKAGTIVADLKRDFGLGHGPRHGIYALLKGIRAPGD